MENFEENNHSTGDFDASNPFDLTESQRFSEVASLLMVLLVLVGSFLKVMFF